MIIINIFSLSRLELINNFKRFHTEVHNKLYMYIFIGIFLGVGIFKSRISDERYRNLSRLVEWYLFEFELLHCC